MKLATPNHAEDGDNPLHPLPEIMKILEGSPEGERFLHNLLLSTDPPKGEDKKKTEPSGCCRGVKFTFALSIQRFPPRHVSTATWIRAALTTAPMPGGQTAARPGSLTGRKQTSAWRTTLLSSWEIPGRWGSGSCSRLQMAWVPKCCWYPSPHYYYCKCFMTSFKFAQIYQNCHTKFLYCMLTITCMYLTLHMYLVPYVQR